jgi:hypothetical protein
MDSLPALLHDISRPAVGRLLLRRSVPTGCTPGGYVTLTESYL